VLGDACGKGGVLTPSRIFRRGRFRRDPGELVGQRRRKKLNPMKRREIAESVISGRKSGAEIARLYEISQPTISRIVAQYRANRP
jgi:transposase-like protein